MNSRIAAIAIGMTLTAAIASAAPAPAPTPAAAPAAAAASAAARPAYVTAALADPGRTDADRTADDLRKPADMIAFAGIQPGSVVGELQPGGGYFTRIFTKVVGPTGKVFAITTPPAAGRASAIAPLAAAPGSNITLVQGPLDAFKVPQPLDVAWTSRNYHDWTPANRALINKAVFEALKPGGIYIVLDHAAVSGSGPSTLHRMDETLARTELAAAGFVFVSSSEVLRNPADNRTTPVFDADIRARTDQFILKYRKP